MARADTPSLRLRRATSADLSLIEAELRFQYEHSDLGLAYPRCETAEELLAEFKLYDLDWRQELRVLEDPAQRALAAFGYLFNREDLDSGTMIERANRAMAYGVGPFIFNRTHPSIALDEVVKWMENLAGRRFGSLRLCIGSGYHELAELLQERNWIPVQRNLEMKWEAANKSRISKRSYWPIIQLSGPNDPYLKQVGALLGESFDWQDNHETRMKDYVDDGYHTAMVIKEGVVLGACVWTKVEGTEFGRLEYVAVDSRQRRQQIATTLALTALEDLRLDGCKEVYLSVNPDALAARRLYSCIGFIPTVQSTVYELNFVEPR